MDDAALNYDEAAGCDNGSCIYEGCTYNLACNYNPIASVDDGSCEFGTCPGCTDPAACNFNPTLTEDDGSCTYGVCGCNLSYACNYDEEATANDGSCEFTSCDAEFSFVFTNCGAEGRFGPSQSQCDSEYGAGFVVSENGIQQWTVPVSGLYTVQAVGAASGIDDNSSIAGHGASVQGEVYLIQGELLKVLVGQKGSNNSVSASAGGGGGSFVIRSPFSSDADIVMIAGGGGACESCGGNSRSEFHGQTGLSGSDGWSACGQTGTGGTEGYGGSCINGNSGGGGGGFFGNGQNGCPGGEEASLLSVVPWEEPR